MRYLARVAPSGECLRSKGKMVHSIRGYTTINVWVAGKTVWCF